MNEMVNTNMPDGVLDSLAQQAQMFVQGAAMNLLQLGRVLCEAKPLVAHGEWAEWVRVNAKMSPRTAEQYMQAYREFGLDARIAELGSSKVIKLLPMSSEEREKLMEENDIGTMSARELDAAIRRQREQIEAEARAEVEKERREMEEIARRQREEIETGARIQIEKERRARFDAERRAQEAEARDPAIPDEVTETLKANQIRIRNQEEEIHRLSRMTQEALNERRRLETENRSLQKDIRDRDELLEDQQAEIDRAQEELLNARSAMARNEADYGRTDRLTADAFAQAVQGFIGRVARLPQMRAEFARMDSREKGEYSTLLQTVEAWAKESRRALDALVVEVSEA